MSKTIYIDVDDTIVRAAGGKRVPIPSVIKRVRELFDAGCTLYCWSSGGADYARESAAEFGIEDCFTAFLPKPEIMIDDQKVEDWKYCSHFHPSEVGKITLHP